LESIFRLDSAENWSKALTAFGVTAVSVGSGGLGHVLLDQNLLTKIDRAGWGPYWQLPTKLEFSASSTSVRDAPGVGEHTRAILGSVGFTPREIEELISSGAAGVVDRGDSIGSTAG
jgi:crotonobetainyl-CoA:carnitine CoA-transferase CaiB-like acyl-CoA transferase